MDVNGTPRRLAGIINNLSSGNTDNVRIVRGPAVKHAYDVDGKPTKAAKGFASSQGVAIDELEIRSIDDGEYVIANLLEEKNEIPAVMVKVSQPFNSHPMLQLMKTGIIVYQVMIKI